MKRLLILATILFSLSSCKKMALNHTCTCTLGRSINGSNETLGTISEDQIGTYSTARDTCNKLRDQYTYARNSPEGVEFHTAICEID